MKTRQYAILGLLIPILFWMTYIIMAVSRPEYSLFTKAVSELGSVDAPNKWIWNGLGYMLTGMLISVYSFGLFNEVSQGKGTKLPLIGFILSGFFMAFSGVFPGDFDDRQSTTMILHTVGSIGSYIFFLLGAFTYPMQMRKSDYWKQCVKPTLIFTWLTILFGAWAIVFPNIPAVGQRFVFFFYLLWIFYTALKLFHVPARKHNQSEAIAK